MSCQLQNGLVNTFGGTSYFAADGTWNKNIQAIVAKVMSQEE